MCASSTEILGSVTQTKQGAGRVMLFKQKSFWAENVGRKAENPFSPVLITHGATWVPVASNTASLL